MMFHEGGKILSRGNIKQFHLLSRGTFYVFSGEPAINSVVSDLPGVRGNK